MKKEYSKTQSRRREKRAKDLGCNVDDLPDLRGMGNHAKSINAGRWNNNKIISTEGYVKIRVGKTHPLADPNGYCYEHKLVVASAYGIDAIKGKLIHHKKGKTDNRLENLEIQTRSFHNSLHNAERGRNKKGQFLRRSKSGSELDGAHHKEFPT